MYGGKKYGTGAKGYLTDIFTPEDEKDKDFFTYKLKDIDNKFNTKFKLICVKRDDINKKDDINKEDPVFNRLPFVNNDEDLENYKENLKDFLIKVYDKKDFFDTEYKQSINLIRDGLINDYILNSDRNYIIGLIYESSKGHIYGLFKRKCQYTLDKFVLVDCNPNISIKYSLQEAMAHILVNIIELQEKHYVHCDIKADNIMVCGKLIKLIDWDLAVKNTNYDEDTICKLSYHGSATHQSPLILDIIDKICKKNFDKLKQGIFMSASNILYIRNIPKKHNKINEHTIKFFTNKENLENLIRYHLDLYSISHVIYELCGTREIYKIFKQDNNLINFITILQNTIEIKKENENYNIFYINESGNKNKIILPELLKLIDSKYYIILKKNMHNTYSSYKIKKFENLSEDDKEKLELYNIKKFKQKYLKYKTKYLKLSKIISNYQDN